MLRTMISNTRYNVVPSVSVVVVASGLPHACIYVCIRIWIHVQIRIYIYEEFRSNKATSGWAWSIFRGAWFQRRQADREKKQQKLFSTSSTRAKSIKIFQRKDLMLEKINLAACDAIFRLVYAAARGASMRMNSLTWNPENGWLDEEKVSMLVSRMNTHVQAAYGAAENIHWLLWLPNPPVYRTHRRETLDQQHPKRRNLRSPQGFLQPRITDNLEKSSFLWLYSSTRRRILPQRSSKSYT